MLRLLAASALLIGLALPQVGQCASPKWEKLYTRDGVTVFAKDHPDRSLPALRGVGVLPTNLYLLMAVIDDVPRHREWVYRLAQSTLVSRPDPFHATAYLRFDFPWPSSDRDGVVKIVVERRWVPHHEIWIRFQRTTHSKRPEVSGVVRVPRSIGYTRLRWIGPNKTHVIYQIDTDPGGWLPKWLVRWISRDLPLRILRGLRKQLKRRSGDYGAFQRRWDPRNSWQSDAPDTFSLLGVPPAKLAKRPLSPAHPAP